MGLTRLVCSAGMLGGVDKTIVCSAGMLGGVDKTSVQCWDAGWG